jgi:hypothetical protein
MNENIEDVLNESRVKALQGVAIVAGLLVYGGMLIYSGVHNISLMSVGVAPDMMIWAMVGVVALELSAAALPLALHFWTYDPLHKGAAMAFYLVDLVVIFLNVILDFNHTAGADLTMTWARAWMQFGVPATPIIAGVGWAILFQLDPSARQRAALELHKAATRETRMRRMTGALKSANIDAAVTAASQRDAENMAAKLLGVTIAPAALPSVASSRDAAPAQLPVDTNTFASSSEPLPVAAAAPLPVATVVPPRNRKRPAQTASSSAPSGNPTKASSRR